MRAADVAHGRLLRHESRMDATLRVRPAAAADYPTFVRLFPELGVDDAIMAETRFATEIVPTALVAELDTQGGRAAVGYAHFQIMRDVAYVRHLMTTGFAPTRSPPKTTRASRVRCVS